MQMGEVNYEKETYPAVVVAMEPEAKAVKKAFEDFMKDKYDVHLRGIGFLANKDVISAEKVTIPKLSDKQLDFHAKVIEEDDITRMSVFAILGYDISVSKANENTDFIAMKNIVGEFLDDYLPNYYQEKLEEAKDQVESLEKDRKDYRGTIEDNKKEIEKLQKENEKLSEKLEESESELNAALEKQSELQTKLESIKNQLRNKGS